MNSLRRQLTKGRPNESQVRKSASPLIRVEAFEPRVLFSAIDLGNNELQIESDYITEGENAGAIEVTITRDSTGIATTLPLNLDFSGTAELGVDYTASAMTAVISPGSISTTVTILPAATPPGDANEIITIQVLGPAGVGGEGEVVLFTNKISNEVATIIVQNAIDEIGSRGSGVFPNQTGNDQTNQRIGDIQNVVNSVRATQIMDALTDLGLDIIKNSINAVKSLEKKTEKKTGQVQSRSARLSVWFGVLAGLAS